MYNFQLDCVIQVTCMLNCIKCIWLILPYFLLWKTNMTLVYCTDRSISVQKGKMLAYFTVYCKLFLNHLSALCVVCYCYFATTSFHYIFTNKWWAAISRESMDKVFGQSTWTFVFVKQTEKGVVPGFPSKLHLK